MRDNKGRLLGCLLAVTLLIVAMVPLSVRAAEGQTGYVMIKSTVYSADGTIRSSSEYEYDKNGNEIRRTSYRASGAIDYYLEFEYDGNGNMTKYTEYAGNGTVRWCVGNEYDANGNLIKSTNFAQNGSVNYSAVHEYDADGRLVKSITTDSRGSVSFISTKEYDAFGRIIKETGYNANGTVSGYSEYEYDGNGNLIKDTEYAANGTVSGCDEYEYDANGNQTKHTVYREGAVYSVDEYEYDANGNQTKHTVYREGAVYSVDEYEYDANGNQVKRTRYGGDGSIDSVGVNEYALLEYAGTAPEGNCFASYEGFSFYQDADGSITCYDSNKEKVINDFKCDGTYTYYFQLDGTAMKDRLSYHPDGEHIIYFDGNGHEVFSDFANVKKSIAGDPVDDFCFFDVNGYLYVDVVTYDKTGTVLYYANPYGVMERGKWFQFSDTVMCADGTPWAGAAGGYGYANEDGTLMKDQWTYDWQGRYCYMQGNGVALYE